MIPSFRVAEGLRKAQREFGGCRTFHATTGARSGEGMTEGAFTKLVDDCLEDLYGHLEVRGPLSAHFRILQEGFITLRGSLRS